jgi:DNA helicase-2/ATP-dependent DNA helicase PcrA
MDFDDQMVYALTMLTHYPQVLAYFQELYPYICVDEAQDTSKIQHRIIAQLARRDEHLFMVGDEDQSIYGFRAAYPEALLSFEKNHKDARVLVMEENFRSNAQIVSAADRLIQKNEFRHRKTMRSSRPAGTAVREIELISRRAQYSYLLQMARDCTTETAVLYRDNESILPVVDLLERDGIDYRIRNADLTFFSHRIILDVESIIRFAQDPYDTELFLKMYYKIGTYMSKAAALEACQLSTQKELPVLEAALRFGRIPAGTQKSVKSMQDNLRMLLQESAAQAVSRIARVMGYSDYLERVHINDGKLRILEALAANELSADRLLERLQELAGIVREKQSSPDCKLILSTIHSSKGLEYDTVYLLDAIDGIFPENVIRNRNQASLEERKVYEEQRRLYYVAVTRAKNHLNIFSLKDKSTFTNELMGKEKMKLPQQRPSGKIITDQVYQEKLEEILTTGYVKHKTFGEGKLLSADGDTLEIQFKNKNAKCKLRFMLENGIIE